LTTEVRKVGVVGLGTMGAGIAQVCAQAGMDVVALEASDELAADGLARMTRFLDEGVRRGRLDEPGRDAVLARVDTTTDAASLAGAGLVIEAVREQLDLKRAVLADVARAVGEEAVIATNTSALSVTAVAAGLPAPERVGGLHFFNPAPLMRLVEVVRAVRTSDATVAALTALAERLGKTAVVTKDRPGFLVNRLLMPYLNQVIADYDAGLAAAEDLDAALELGLGYPLGGLKVLDLVGLDVHLHATRAAWEQSRDPHLVPPPLLERMVDAGRLGRKSGRGFYEHAS
jgi:3-hydroxybutyryl-CoA dehydrogenase